MKNLLITSLVIIFTTALISCSEEKNEVLDEMKAAIDVSNIDFITELDAVNGLRIKAGQSVTFADGSDGEPDGWSWTFPGGSPSFSTDQNPTVVWDDAVGEIIVELVITRSADGIENSSTFNLQVGPLELLKSSVFSFHSSADIDEWQTWSQANGWGDWSGDERASFSYDGTEGANGTVGCGKIERNYTLQDDGVSTAWLQLGTWNNTNDINATLNSNTDYVYSFWIKGSAEMNFNDCSFMNRSNDQEWIDWEGSKMEPLNISTSWKKIVLEFNTGDIKLSGIGYEDGRAYSSAPFFQVNPSDNSVDNIPVTVYIDEFSLKEKEAN